MPSDALHAVQLVKLAADGLTLACVEVVGPVPMSLSLPTVAALGEPVPRKWWRKLRLLNTRG